MTNKRIVQDRLCPNFESYMKGMEQDLQELVMKPTTKRLKILILAAKDPIIKLLTLFELSNAIDGFNYYKIPQKLFDSFKTHVISVLQQKCKKGVNFGRVKKTMDQAKVWGVFKGYWFHNAPKEMTEHLWTALLRDISKYFDNISTVYGSNNPLNWSESVIGKFLKLMFVKNIFEVKCQINAQSNPSGPVIQFAAWKQPSMQQVLNCFDETYHMKWGKWLHRKSGNGKKMRINAIIQDLVKTYAQRQFRKYCTDSVAINMEYSEFSVSVNVIENMRLSAHTRDGREEDKGEDKSQSDQLSLTTNISSAGSGSDAVTDVYNGYHSVSVVSSDYRSHPYSPFHVQCPNCRKCKHHCRCYSEPIIPSQEAIFNNYYYYQSYPYPYPYPPHVPVPYYGHRYVNESYQPQMPPLPPLPRINDLSAMSDFNNMEIDVNTAMNDFDDFNNFQTVTNDEMPNHTLLSSTDHDMSSLIGIQDGTDANNGALF